MTQAPSFAFYMAGLIAMVFHAGLFFVVQPKPAEVLRGELPTPPRTFFMTPGGEDLPVNGTPVRTIVSPVLFSLPSAMGFSRELYEQKIETPRFIPKSGTPEQFLEADPVGPGVGIDSQALMLTTTLAGAPDIPGEVFGAEKKGPSARRVTLAPELKDRIVGGVVLPAELNQDVSNAWEVRAKLHVSGEGVVQHVFLEKPLESAPLNVEILKLLYGLQFNEGTPLDGTVEIYSAEPARTNGEAAE
ncbi:hypothetical protein [Pontiella sp.]|uniref:hypothetical protein n=1 Tax=Pontiella sp. TaxID=2837462 RepID=UPI003569E2EB